MASGLLHKKKLRNEKREGQMNEWMDKQCKNYTPRPLEHNNNYVESFKIFVCPFI